jgi:hypothetical protein
MDRPQWEGEQRENAFQNPFLDPRFEARRARARAQAETMEISVLTCPSAEKIDLATYMMIQL